MRIIIFYLLLFIPSYTFCQQFSSVEITRWELESKKITIIRDTWGIPHVYGKTDADAIFGLLYAQCEDDFKRVELNCLENLGRMSEVMGENYLYQDLQMRLIYDSVAAINDYNKSEPWFKKLLDAAADGVNYYLYKHPEVTSVVHRFKPWYQLMRTNGSISATNTGGVSLAEIKKFYSSDAELPNEHAILNEREKFPELTGSNGFAVAPSKTINKNAILYINPHVTFYFRTEVQMTSDEGLNAYGAVTWGQFFVFQGFNQHCGWMHTTSYADLADLYMEKIVKKDGVLFYEYDNKLLPIKSKQITISYKKDDHLLLKTFAGYYTHHGPVVASRDGRWLSLKENNRSLQGLMQSWLRTKANGFAAFEKTMQLRSNTSDNTVYADDKGNIGYWHGNFIPVRDTTYDWSKPVDGTTSKTEWKGIHQLDEIVHVYDPSSGWIQNCNSTPFTVSGKSSPAKNKYPKYMAPDGQNPRAINAAHLLNNENNYTIDKMIETGYNTHLAAFDILLPSLFSAYDEIKNDTSFRLPPKEAIDILRSWDKNSSVNSIATTLATEWGNRLMIYPPQTDEERNDGIKRFEMLVTYISPKQKLNYLKDVINWLGTEHGNWKIPWGELNRYQRNTSNIVQKFDDTKPSLAVGLASSLWGCLPSFSSIRVQHSKLRYGVNGNSFVAAVEFGKKIKAKSIVTGGEGMDPSSKHFMDQAQMYIDGKFKDILFYKEDVLKHMERKYHPGSPL